MDWIVLKASLIIFALPFISILMARHSDSVKFDKKDGAIIAGYAGITLLSLAVL